MKKDLKAVPGKSSKKANAKKEKGDKSVVSRRRAFKQIFGEMIVCFDEIRGNKHFAFSDLNQLEREKLEELIPVVNKAFEISLDENWLIGKKRDSGEKVRIFELSLDKAEAFNLINGKNTIGEISRIHSRKMNWELEQSFGFVKNMVLDFISRKLCLFTNPVDD